MNAGQRLDEELAEVWEECSKPDWDAYNALPVTKAVYDNARAFVRSIPPGIQPPSVGAEPDGSISFEWHNETRRTLTVSVGSGGLIHLAALLGVWNISGSKEFKDACPPVILNIIKRVYR